MRGSGLPMHTPSCLPLVTALNYACSLTRTCCSTTRCGLRREPVTTGFGAAPADIVRVAGGAVTDLKR